MIVTEMHVMHLHSKISVDNARQCGTRVAPHQACIYFCNRVFRLVLAEPLLTGVPHGAVGFFFGNLFRVL